MRKKNIHIEVIRGVAAFLVVTGHLITKVPDKLLPKSHFTALLSNWGTEAVIIFFILSGIVIHSSFDRKPRTRKRFFIERILRLHPILLLSIVVAAGVEMFVFGKNVPLIVLMSNIIPVSTLEGILAPVLYKSNPVIWSLSFEVFFYGIFGGLIISGCQVDFKRVMIWLFASVIAMGFHLQGTQLTPILSYLVMMFAFSPIWIVGFLIWKYREVIPVTKECFLFSLLMLPLISRLHLTEMYYDPLKYLLFAITAIPALTFLVNNCRFSSIASIKFTIYLQGFVYVFASLLLCSDDSYLPAVRLSYIILPLLSLAISLPILYRGAKLIYLRVLAPLFSSIGSISYSLYLIHYPTIITIFALSFPPLIEVLVAIMTFTLVSIFLEFVFQPRITRWYYT